MSLSNQSFVFVADLVRRETAMLYEPGKEYLVEARLQPLAREAGCADVDAFVARLRVDAQARRLAVDALTINETSWFRDNAPYRALATSIVPALLERRSASRHLRVWSAACSSGQEPYSIAMVLDQHLPQGWTAEILATDVSGAMVERCRLGRYSQVEMNRGLPASSLVAHFGRHGSDWEVSPRLRRMVRVQQLNLAAPLPPLPTFDVVFLRNVLIYFDLPTKQAVLRRVHGTMAADGYLVLGSAETTLGVGDEWTRESAGTMPLHRPSSAASLTTPGATAGLAPSLLRGA